MKGVILLSVLLVGIVSCSRFDNPGQGKQSRQDAAHIRYPNMTPPVDTAAATLASVAAAPGTLVHNVAAVPGALLSGVASLPSALLSGLGSGLSTGAAPAATAAAGSLGQGKQSRQVTAPIRYPSRTPVDTAAATLASVAAAPGTLVHNVAAVPGAVVSGLASVPSALVSGLGSGLNIGAAPAALAALGIPPRSKSVHRLKRDLSNKCVSQETSSCIALELVGYVDKMLRTASVQLSDDVLIFDESHGAAADLPVKTESLARAGVSVEDQAQQLITDKLWNFATSRSLRYRILDDADLVISGKQDKDTNFGVDVSIKPHQEVETGRERNKNFGPFLAAAGMKIGLLAALTFKGLALMVGKALLISKIALLLATIIGLKKLFSHQVIKKD